jgi:hypothetical protein
VLVDHFHVRRCKLICCRARFGEPCLVGPAGL